MASVGERVAGRWRLRRSIGRGAMGEVFLADDGADGGVAAIKLLHPSVVDEDAVDAFALEGRTLARIHHPVVVALLGRGVHGGVPFVAMEHIGGTTLAALIAASPAIRLPLPRVIALLRTIADGVDAVHRAGALHGDIKPTNILLGSHRVALADFGLAHPYGPGCRTLAGSVRGTPLYLAPELASGISIAPDRASDIYAFATVAYELLAGRPPLGGGSVREVIARHVDDDPPVLSRARPELRAADPVFERALSKRRAERPRSANAFVRALERALGVTPPTQTPRRLVYP